MQIQLKSRFTKLLGFSVLLAIVAGPISPLVSLTTASSCDQFILNPGFEDGLNNWDAYQYEVGWSSTPADPHTGSYALEFLFPGGAGYYDASIQSNQFYVEAGVTYVFSWWIREFDTHDTFDPAETILDVGVSCGEEYIDLGRPTKSQTWMKYEKSVVFAQSGFATLDFQIHGYSTSGSAFFMIDDVCLQPMGSGWCDDFEALSGNDDWAAHWHGSGNVDGITIDNTESYGGENSLRLFGQVGACWGAVVTRPIQFQSSLDITLDVRNGTEDIFGCHPYRASIGIRTGGPDWQDCPCPAFVTFLEQGGLQVHPPSQDPIEFNEYPLEVWYQVKLNLHTPGDGLLHVRIWVNNEFLQELTMPEESWMHDDSYLDLSSQEGTVWFDNVCVLEMSSNLLRLGQSNCTLSLSPGEMWIPVYLDNAIEATAGDIPLSYDWPIDPTSISFEGTRMEAFDYLLGEVDVQNSVLRIGFVANLNGSGESLSPVDEATQDIPIAKIMFNRPQVYECGTAALVAPEITSIVTPYDVFTLEIVDVGGNSHIPTVMRETTEFRNFRIGDVNLDARISITDPVKIINYIFAGHINLCIDAADANCDGTVSITDPVYEINYIFAGGPIPGANCLCGAEPPLGKAAPADVFVTSDQTAEDRTFLISSYSASQLQAAQFVFEVAGDVSGIEVKPADTRFQVYSGFVDGEFRVGLIDLTAKTTLPAGSNQLVEISHEGSGTMTLAEAILVDSDARELLVTISQQKLDAVFPTEFVLYQNKPNPFNPSTEIEFSVPKACDVRLVVYNLLGQEVATVMNGFVSAGAHRATWDGRDNTGNSVASGVYLYRIETAEFSQTRKMVLLK